MRFVGKDHPDELHYHTRLIYSHVPVEMLLVARQVADIFRSHFREDEDGNVFGTIAIRDKYQEFFITTARGKRELDDWVIVESVNHTSRTVYSGPKKATLNAPLLDYLFTNHPDIQAIVHWHDFDKIFPTLGYEEPGTIADTYRLLPKDCKGFNISEHGVFRLFDHIPTEDL